MKIHNSRAFVGGERRPREGLVMLQPWGNTVRSRCIRWGQAGGTLHDAKRAEVRTRLARRLFQSREGMSMKISPPAERLATRLIRTATEKYSSQVQLNPATTARSGYGSQGSPSRSRCNDSEGAVKIIWTCGCGGGCLPIHSDDYDLSFFRSTGDSHTNPGKHRPANPSYDRSLLRPVTTWSTQLK